MLPLGMPRCSVLPACSERIGVWIHVLGPDGCGMPCLVSILRSGVRACARKELRIFMGRFAAARLAKSRSERSPDHGGTSTVQQHYPNKLFRSGRRCKPQLCQTQVWHHPSRRDVRRRGPNMWPEMDLWPTLGSKSLCMPCLPMFDRLADLEMARMPYVSPT